MELIASSIQETVDVTGLNKEWKVIEAIEEAMQRNDLYEIYLQGI
jgi:hypothetical protein